MDYDEVIESWPDAPKEVAKEMVAKYGEPDEVTPSHVIWHNNGPWKKTTVYRDEIEHKFPKPHTDLLEQSINYKVPVEKFSELAEFDGSVIIERTKGVMAARCDKEGANTLALNLADEIIRDEKTVDEARQTYAEQIMAMMAKQEAPYTEKLMFKVPTGNTEDPDESVITESMMNKAKEGTKDAWEDIKGAFTATAHRISGKK